MSADQKDIWGLQAAALVAGNSNDPSTKTGAVIHAADGVRMWVGYNRFPRGVRETPERLNDRAVKYPMTVHAELNALLRAGDKAKGGTLYCHPWPPCAPCAGAIIQAGIARVVAVVPTPEQEERWSDSFKIMQTMFAEAGVVLDTIPASALD